MPFPAPGDPLMLKRAELARMYQRGKPAPDPEVAAALRREIKTAEIERYLRKAFASESAPTTSQRQHLVGVILGSA